MVSSTLKIHINYVCIHIYLRYLLSKQYRRRSFRPAPTPSQQIIKSIVTSIHLKSYSSCTHTFLAIVNLVAARVEVYATDQ